MSGHAEIDALVAAEATPCETEKAIDDFLEIGALLDGGLQQQMKPDHAVGPDAPHNMRSTSNSVASWGEPSMRTRVLPTLMSMAPAGPALTTEAGVGGSISCAGASTVTGNNPTGSYSPARNARRHLNSKFVFTPCSIASRATDTPGSQASLASFRRNSTG